MLGLKTQLTFDSEEARVIIEKNTKSDISGYPCQVVGGGGPRGENVFVFHLRYELDNEAVKAALERFWSSALRAPPASPTYFYSYRDAHCSHDSWGAYP